MSLSGSETDVSTSNENLSPEERHVLRTSIRQEPQGEETLLASSPATDKSTNNTLIIHHNKSIDGGLYPVSPFFYGNYNQNVNANSINEVNKLQNSQTQLPSIALALNKLGINQNILLNGSPPHLQLISSRTSSSESVSTSPNTVNKVFFNHMTGNVNCDSMRNYSDLQQPMLENYLNSLSNWKSNDNNKNAYSDVMKNLPPPPPQYERSWSNESPNSASTSASNSTTPESKSNERLCLSRSHPDLSKFDEDSIKNIKESILTNNGDSKRIIEMIISENIALKNQLDAYYKKVSKLRKVSYSFCQIIYRIIVFN